MIRQSLLRVCVDHDPATHKHFLPAALAAGFKAAASHVQQRNCEYISECDSLLNSSAVNLSITLFDVSSKLTALAAASSALECQALGAQLYLLGSESLVNTIVPINTANQMVTGAAT
eukprot:scaffold257550_cov41-Prasinocladus_malaysianus.AAC.1